MLVYSTKGVDSECIMLMYTSTYAALTLSNLSNRMMRMSWYSVSLSRMMSGSVTVADSSLLLLDCGKLDCLQEESG